MESTTLTDLIALLSGPSLVVRTGLWLAPTKILYQAPSEAARLGIDAADARAPLLAELPADARFVGLDSERVVRALDALCRQPAASSCLLVYNLDVLLAGLRQEARLDVWQFLFSGFRHRSRALLFLIPQRGNELLPPPESLHAWRRDGRLVGEPRNNLEV